MSIFVPPLSLDPYYEFLKIKNTQSGYSTFLAYAESGNNDLSQAFQRKIDQIKPKYKALVLPPKSDTTIPLRDDKNYIGFRMAMRIAGKLKISSLSAKDKLSISLVHTGVNELIWSDDILAQPAKISTDPKTEDLSAEAFHQATSGDLFIIRYFLESFDHKPTAGTPIPNIIWNFFSIWNAIQIPLAQTIFNAKSKNKKWHRPCDEPSKKPILYGLTRPPHDTYPSGHAAGAGALAGLIYAVCLATGNASQADKYIPIAYRIGLVREFANLHWTEDTEAGFLIGFRFTYAVLAMFEENDLLEDIRWLVAKVCDEL